MKGFRADLHIHSCLSPCAELDMSPTGIVERSLEAGLDMIAVCDHNSAENVGAVIRAGSRGGLYVFPGMEVNSLEEVHTLAIFDSEHQALAMQEVIYRHIRGSNRPELFGEQVIANEFDEVDGFNDRLLIGAAQMELRAVVREVHRLGGLCIASHVDRPSFSVLSQLGFVPAGLELDAVEISFHMDGKAVMTGIPGVGGLPVVTFSDAHFLQDIGRAYTTFFIESPSIAEVRLALANESGRRAEIH